MQEESFIAPRPGFVMYFNVWYEELCFIANNIIYTRTSIYIYTCTSRYMLFFSLLFSSSFAITLLGA